MIKVKVMTHRTITERHQLVLSIPDFSANLTAADLSDGFDALLGRISPEEPVRVTFSHDANRYIATFTAASATEEDEILFETPAQDLL